MAILQFDSRRNYMKKAKILSTTMSGPNSASPYTATYERTVSIPHGITNGKVPFARVFYEPWRDGRITAAYEDSQDWLSDPPNNYGGFPGNAPVCSYWVDATNVYIQLRYQTNTFATTDFPIHVIAYRDFGVV
jgi:hypothetical protein